MRHLLLSLQVKRFLLHLHDCSIDSLLQETGQEFDLILFPQKKVLYTIFSIFRPWEDLYAFSNIYSIFIGAGCSCRHKSFVHTSSCTDFPFRKTRPLFIHNHYAAQVEKSGLPQMSKNLKKWRKMTTLSNYVLAKNSSRKISSIPYSGMHISWSGNKWKFLARLSNHLLIYSLFLLFCLGGQKQIEDRKESKTGAEF